MMNNKFLESITKEEIRELPLDFFKGNITVVNNTKTLKTAISIIKKSKTWGFDTETKPSFKKGQKNNIALIQLANDTDAFIFQLVHIGFAKEILDILSDQSITKVGSDVKQDLKKIKESFADFTPQNFVDIQTIAKENGIKDVSLKKLAAIVLGIRISKRQQLSNWERQILTPAQIKYAATDAWVTYQIYKKLID
jgi:ribonuclease D